MAPVDKVQSLASDDEQYHLAILAEVEKVCIVVPVLPWPTLVSRARAHNDRDETEHIVLSYLCSLYEKQFQRVYYATLDVEAPSLLRARVLREIAVVYPQLSDAAKQLATNERHLLPD
jgi:hypothetical protein